MNDKKICLLGGDLRMLYALRALCRHPFEISVFGLDGDIGNATAATDLKAAIQNARAVVLPLPFSTDGIRVFAPLCDHDIKLNTLLSALEKGQLIIGGKLSEGFCQKAAFLGCDTYDYYTSEKLSVMNAIPTAEGALSIAINETPKTLFGSKCVISGYGRIGKILAKYLKSLGAEVTVLGRSEQALAWIKADGCNPLTFDQAAEAMADKDIIFNTVPALCIKRDMIENTKKDVVMIDLASAPGGIDTEYAKALSRKVIFAQSLPGKFAPESSGEIIADRIISKLKGGIV